MKQLKTVLPIIMLMVVVGLSCKKDTSISKSQLLVGTWHLSAFGFDNNMNGVLEVSEHIVIPAGSDIIDTFNSNYTGSITTISGGVSTVTPFTWELQNNDTQIIVTSTAAGSISTNTINISQLTKTQLMGYEVTGNPRTIILLVK